MWSPRSTVRGRVPRKRIWRHYLNLLVEQWQESRDGMRLDDLVFISGPLLLINTVRDCMQTLPRHPLEPWCIKDKLRILSLQQKFVFRLYSHRLRYRLTRLRAGEATLPTSDHRRNSISGMFPQDADTDHSRPGLRRAMSSFVPTSIRLIDG